MYSDSASVLESIATLLQVLFHQEPQESRTMPVPMYDDDLQYREHLLSELVIAIGLQTNHFMEAQRQGTFFPYSIIVTIVLVLRCHFILISFWYFY